MHVDLLQIEELIAHISRGLKADLMLKTGWNGRAAISRDNCSQCLTLLPLLPCQFLRA
jgi:hypothetical protein